jgi:hypothetical protein
MTDSPEAFTLLIYSTGWDSSAVAWTGDLPQFEFDNHGDNVDGWSHDYSAPKPAGLWLASGTVLSESPASIAWRRLTDAEAIAVAGGEWPLPGSGT